MEKANTITSAKNAYLVSHLTGCDDMASHRTLSHYTSIDTAGHASKRDLSPRQLSSISSVLFRWFSSAFPFIASILFSVYVSAQSAPKQEFRGVWVATVLNIDFPKEGTPNDIAHSEQWKKLLDKYKKMGMNAVVVQVRPAGDALYPTDLAPWSAYLTGQQGRPPLRDVDPLQMMIQEAHERGMEFHAWFNPYRLTMNLDTAALAPSHVFYTHPEWVLRYDTKYYLDPGLPDVQDYLIEVVGEVVERYDIDAVHFDDYFYPYKVKNQTFPDTTSFREYANEGQELADWRRSNVDFFIDSLSLRIKELKSHVKFGISPFGVWRNAADDPLGSKTRAGLTSYDHLYADILKWLRNDWIDYVAPQMYWHIGFPPADYEELLRWWRGNTYGKHLYVGHAVYKVNTDQYVEWNQPTELPRQIQLLRNERFHTKGSIFFSSRQLLKNPLGVTDSLRQHYYAQTALLPPAPFLDDSIPPTPTLKKMRSRKGQVKLRWKLPRKFRKNPPAYYAIYRFPNDTKGNLDLPQHLIATTAIGQKNSCFIDDKAQNNRVYNYQVTALSRTHIESDPSNRRMIHKRAGSLKNIKRLPDEFLLEQKERTTAIKAKNEAQKKNGFFYD